MTPSPDTGSPPHPRWRDGLAAMLLGAYVLLPALVYFSSDAPSGPALAPSLLGVLSVVAWELVLFTLVFGAACRMARLGAPELRWRWTGGWRAVPRAFLWSVLLRLVMVAFLTFVHLLITWASRGAGAAALESSPGLHAIADPQALRDPLYLLLMLTLVSFVVAGLREELWRAAMLTLLPRLFPSRLGGSRGPWLAVVPVAVLFGLGHASQGVLGIYGTLLIGVGLGALMLWRNALSDAVLVHGWFNATSFLLAAAFADELTAVTR